MDVYPKGLEVDREAVDDLKRRMAAEGLKFGRAHELNEDVWLQRFVVARSKDKNPREATWKQLRATLEWRRDNEIDTLLEWFPASDVGKQILAYWPTQEMGIAPNGMPVVCEQMTLLDPSVLLAAFDGEDLLDFHFFIMERGLLRCERAGVAGEMVIQNLAGLGMHHLHQPALDLAKRMLALDSAHYPESLGALFVIHSPSLFPFIYRMLQPFIDPRTKEKIKVVPDLTEVPMSVLPRKWGGESPIEWTKLGGAFVVQKDGSQEVRMTVAARSVEKIAVALDKDGCSLSWHLTSDGADIGFGVVRGKTVVERVERVPAHVEPHTGMLHGLKSGTYHLVLDNEYSWTTAKTVAVVFFVGAPLTKSQKKNMRRRNAKKKKGIACAACGYKLASANAKMCPQCGSTEKVVTQ